MTRCLCAVAIAALVSVASLAQAVFSAFVVITPANETSHPFRIDTHPLGTADELMRVRVSGPLADGQEAWLITCKQSLLSEKQNFRSAVWSQSQGNEDIVHMQQVNPVRAPSVTADGKAEAYIEVVLTGEEMQRSYIYIDYPSEVRDGGYYYSIDLAYYLQGRLGKKSLIQWEKR